MGGRADFVLRAKQQGLKHDIRCVPVLLNAILSDFYKSVCGPTDGRPTDGRADMPSYRDARTLLKTFSPHNLPVLPCWALVNVYFGESDAELLFRVSSMIKDCYGCISHTSAWHVVLV